MALPDNASLRREGSSTTRLQRQLSQRKLQPDQISIMDTTKRKAQQEPSKRKHMGFMERVREFCSQADVFASAHNVPIHVVCIVVATLIIPISTISIVWDLLAAVIFQIPDLSTINSPAFLLFINFVAIPVAMYGYMMEYLIHEHSRLAVIGFIAVVVHMLLFLLRALIEYKFDGFRGEHKLYFEAFTSSGDEARYPIGIIRYRSGEPFSDSEAGTKIIHKIFKDASDTGFRT